MACFIPLAVSCARPWRVQILQQTIRDVHRSAPVRLLVDTVHILVSKQTAIVILVLAIMMASFSSFAAWAFESLKLSVVMLMSVVRKKLFKVLLAHTQYGAGGECEVDTVDPNLSV